MLLYSRIKVRVMKYKKREHFGFGEDAGKWREYGESGDLCELQGKAASPMGLKFCFGASTRLNKVYPSSPAVIAMNTIFCILLFTRWSTTLLRQ
jgi:hypothetical protein